MEKVIKKVSSSPGRSAKRRKKVDLRDESLYFNRELSWLKFNDRVLEEALDAKNPLLERVKFLSIFSTNLDEFFMIRVSGLRRQYKAGVVTAPPDGMTPAEQLAAIRDQLLPSLDKLHECWLTDLRPRLEKESIKVLSYGELKGKQRKLLRRHFESEIFPVLTPLAFDPGHPFPHISNLSVNLAVVIRDAAQGELFARLKIPQTIPRLLRIPDEEKAESFDRLGLAEVRAPNFVWLEEVVAANLDLLFPGVEVAASYPFRVTRDADLEIEEDEAADLLTAMTEVVGQRHFGSAVRLEVDREMPERIRDILVQNLQLSPYQVYTTEPPIGLADLMGMIKVDRPDLKDKPFQPVVAAGWGGDRSIFAAIREQDHLVYHPFDSFRPVEDFVRKAARDERVLAIKQTLYRVGPNSPIIQALMEARENGKQVSVLVELKARFDEQNNIVWAKALERAGVHVVYGLMGLKTHAKMCLVVRREEEGIRRYLHLGTGNYNPTTARVYTDLGLFTCDREISEDVSHLFNALTGFSRKDVFRRLLVAPKKMRSELLMRIRREIDLHRAEGGGRLIFKMNSLVDPRSIRALYEASQAGVRVDLQIRGICCLKPGVPGVSENIHVTSIVGRFLEHSRIYWFRNGGEEEVLLGSADIMQRNLDGRVEILFPVLDSEVRKNLTEEILFAHLRDTAKSRTLDVNGEYRMVEPEEGEKPFDSQDHLLEGKGKWRREAISSPAGSAC